jgi:SAM-dependent methyltransferase
VCGGSRVRPSAGPLGVVTPPAGDVDYTRYGTGYAGRRRTDPRIAALVHEALGPARTVLNVGAGAGSYEPEGCRVVAVEPSEEMVAQRPTHLGPAVRAVAGALPFAGHRVDASMAMVNVHQWPDPLDGLAEMRRVTSGPVVVLTFDPDAVAGLWLAKYAPDLFAVEASRYPSIDSIATGSDAVVRPVPVPLDCADGFTEAFYGRPEAFLDPEVRRSQSAWSFVEPEVTTGCLHALAADLDSGRWDRRYGSLRGQPWYHGAVRLASIIRPTPG